jgi:hypothetical protein
VRFSVSACVRADATVLSTLLTLFVSVSVCEALVMIDLLRLHCRGASTRASNLLLLLPDSRIESIIRVSVDMKSGLDGRRE